MKNQTIVKKERKEGFGRLEAQREKSLAVRNRT